MDTFRKFAFRGIKHIAISIVSLLVLSCSNDHESGNDHSFETEFEKNYLAVAQLKTAHQQHQAKLTALKKSNFDAYRSIAFTWHSAAMKLCQQNARQEQYTTPKSSYQQLLEANQQSTLSSIPIDSETRNCIQLFFTRNWKEINAMIKLN